MTEKQQQNMPITGGSWIKDPDTGEWIKNGAEQPEAQKADDDEVKTDA